MGRGGVVAEADPGTSSTCHVVPHQEIKRDRRAAENASGGATRSGRGLDIDPAVPPDEVRWIDPNHRGVSCRVSRLVEQLNQSGRPPAERTPDRP